jgi:hypothetical protein
MSIDLANIGFKYTFTGTQRSLLIYHDKLELTSSLFSTFLRLKYTRDVVLAFSLSDAISIEKLVSSLIAITEGSEK